MNESFTTSESPCKCRQHSDGMKVGEYFSSILTQIVISEHHYSHLFLAAKILLRRSISHNLAKELDHRKISVPCMSQEMADYGK